MKKIESLQAKVIQWAEDRGLLDNVTKARIEAQANKVLEEIGETAGACLKKNTEEIIDGAGDIFITIILLAKMREHDTLLEPDYRYDFEDSAYPLWFLAEAVLEFIMYNHIQELIKAISYLNEFCYQNDINIEDCLESSYNVISKRTGKMVNNTFVKDKP